MKKLTIVAGGYLFIAALLMASVLSQQPSTQVRDIKPTLVPLKLQTPVPTPPDQREVAILTLVIESDREGKIESVTLKRGRILRNYAPNVLNRTGPWTVEIVGEEKVRYGVVDPRWLEVFPLREGEPFKSEYVTVLTWELVVPLYSFDKDLKVQVINLYDEARELIFTTEVDREKWK